MLRTWLSDTVRAKSHPARGGWIEIQQTEQQRMNTITSHPARGGWIEIGMGLEAP